jgi:hypothetical protein
LRERYEKSPELLRAALDQTGMVPHPDLLSAADLFSVIDAYEAAGTEAAAARLEELHVELFEPGECRQQIVARWQASPRWPVLNQVLQAHDSGLYFLSTAVALAQAEGVVIDITKPTMRRISEAHLKRLIKTLPHHEVFRPIVRRLVEKTLYQPFEIGEPPPPFSRHAVLHGADLAYGTRRGSLSALVWLDYLLICGRDHARAAAAE